MKIDELSEKEILALTSDELVTMIKFRKAEEGIKLVNKPTPPVYHEIPEPDETVFMCDLFGSELCTKTIDEIEGILSVIRKSTTKCKVDYDYNKAGSEYRYSNSELKKSYNSRWDAIVTQRCYSIELYNSVANKIFENKKWRESYEKELKEYNSAINESKYIESEIMDKFYEVQAKYERLNSLCCKMREDYMPLANSNEEIAFKFLSKAYSMNEEESEYVLANYLVK